MSNEWIKNLKAGDTVIVESKYSIGIYKVDKVTPTGRIVINGGQYDDRGYLRGGNVYHREKLVEATPENLEKTRDVIFRSKAIKQIKAFEFDKLDNETLSKIIDLIDTIK